MLDKILESERLVFKPFSVLSEEEKEIIIKSWNNPFNARYNATKDARKSVNEIVNQEEPTFQDLDNYDDCMYFRVVFDKSTGALVGTCRFGKYYKSENNECWDFGFNVLLSHWCKGYGVEMIGKIIEISRLQGVKFIRGGADCENYGSYKAMIKNGFDYAGTDEDGDYEYILDINKPEKTQSEKQAIWYNHLEMTKKDFGLDKFNRLEFVNKKIIEMVLKIQAGENEDKLVKSYVEELNKIEEFKFN